MSAEARLERLEVERGKDNSKGKRTQIKVVVRIIGMLIMEGTA